MDGEGGPRTGWRGVASAGGRGGSCSSSMCSMHVFYVWMYVCLFYFLFFLVYFHKYQFHILRKLSHEPVATAIPSSVTPKHDTLLSWPANTPARSAFIESQTLQLKSS